MIHATFLRRIRPVLVLAAAVLLAPSSVYSETQGEAKGITEYQSLRYGSEGELLGYGMHQYDEGGRKISTGWYEPAKGNVGNTRFEYDESGRLIRESLYDKTESMLLGYTDYTYSDGEKREAVSYTARGERLSSLAFEYDGEGRPVRETGYGEEGTVREIILHEYDEEGGLAKSSVYGPEGKELVSYALYEHDSQGNLTRMTVYAPDGSVYWYVRHLWGEP